MLDKLSPIIEDNEHLYRGVVIQNWDFEKNQPSSAAFKDSWGTSVDREGKRIENECLDFLKDRKEFVCICKVKSGRVREINAIVKYKPEKGNIYHSEIHDSENKPELSRGKSRRLRNFSDVVYKKNGFL